MRKIVLLFFALIPFYSVFSYTDGDENLSGTEFYLYNDTYSYTTNVAYYGTATYRYACLANYTASSSDQLIKRGVFHVRLHTAAPVKDSFMLVVASSTFETVATSTPVTSSELSTLSWATSTYSFSDITLEAGEDYLFCLYSEYDATGYYKLGGNTSVSTDYGTYHYDDSKSLVYTNSHEPFGWIIGDIVDGGTGTTSTTTEPEPPLIGTSTAEWLIASTTEAFYAVGYSILLYLGVLIVIIFGIMSMKFTKIFIR